MTQPLIPANIVRKLGIDVKKSNQEVIIDFLTQEQGTVDLNKTQKDLLNRWDYADNLLRTRKYKKTEISKMLCLKFSISIATARNDMAEAEYVFGSTRKFNKQYILLNHLDQIDDMIIEAQRRRDDDLVAKLMLIRTRALALLPDEMQKEMPPTKIVFNLTQNNTNEIFMPKEITAEEARRHAAARLKELNIDITPFQLLGKEEEGHAE